MAISPSTSLWWCKVNRFPKPYTVLHRIQQTINFQFICLFIWQFLPGEDEVSNSTCFIVFFPEDKNSGRISFFLWNVCNGKNSTIFLSAITAGKPKISYVSNILWRNHLQEELFSSHVSCRWSVLILFLLISWNSLFGRAAMWVVQGLRAPHSIYTMCTQPWQFKATLIAPFDKLLLILRLAAHQD